MQVLIINVEVSIRDKISIKLQALFIIQAKATEVKKQANLDINVTLFSMLTEAIINFAEYGKGNVIFLNRSLDWMDKTVKQMMSLITKKEVKYK